MKTCTKCKIAKEVTFFYKRKTVSSGCRPMCKECETGANNTWHSKNKERKSQYNKQWVEGNKDKVEIYKTRSKPTRLAYHKNKIKTSDSYKLARNLRTRLYKAVKNNQKAGSAVKDLGCSIEDLKAYLEAKFQLGMAWDNYGLKGWHIDHVKPLCQYDLSNSEEFKKACHYTNLQPLWAKDNLSKGGN